MPAINRYNQTREGLVAQPLSFEDYTRAGTIRADSLGKLSELTGTDLGFDVDIKDNEVVSQQVGQIQEGIDSISNDISKGNVTSSTYDEALQWKRQQSKVFGDVRKAEDNFKLKTVWENEMKLLAAQTNMPTNELNAILERGNEGFTGTFNQDGTTNIFKPEFGPGYIDFAAEFGARFEQVKGQLSEEVEKAINNEDGYVLNRNRIPGQIVVTNGTDGEIISNAPALNAMRDTIYTELEDETSRFGANRAYFGGESVANAKILANQMMESFVSNKITPAQTKTTLKRDDLFLLQEAAKIQAASKPTAGFKSITGKTKRVTKFGATRASVNKHFGAGAVWIEAAEKAYLIDIKNKQKAEDVRVPIGKTVPKEVVHNGEVIYTPGQEPTNKFQEEYADKNAIDIYDKSYKKETKAALESLFTDDMIKYQENNTTFFPKEDYMIDMVVYDKDGNPVLENGKPVIRSIIDERKLKDQLYIIRNSLSQSIVDDIAPQIEITGVSTIIEGEKNKASQKATAAFDDLYRNAGASDRFAVSVDYKENSTDLENSDVTDISGVIVLLGKSGRGFVVGDVIPNFQNSLDENGYYREDNWMRERIGIKNEDGLSYFDIEASAEEQAAVDPFQHSYNRYLASIDNVSPKPLWVQETATGPDGETIYYDPIQIMVIAGGSGQTTSGLMIVQKPGTPDIELPQGWYNNNTAFVKNLRSGNYMNEKEYSEIRKGTSIL